MYLQTTKQKLLPQKHKFSDMWKVKHFDTMSNCQSLQLHQPIIWYFGTHHLWRDPDFEAPETERQAGRN